MAAAAKSPLLGRIAVSRAPRSARGWCWPAIGLVLISTALVALPARGQDPPASEPPKESRTVTAPGFPVSELPVEGSAAPAAPNSVAAMPASESLPDKQPLLRQPPLQRLPDTGLTNPDTVYPVDLCIVLRLADGRNPTIGLAREMIRENLALQRAASVLLLPTLNGGGTYVGHAGDLQRSTGAILDVSRQSFYYGGGAQVWGSGTVNIPAVMIYSHLGDAYFEPLAARQRTRMSEFDARATANTQLLDVTTFYLRLVAAEANLQIYQVSRRDMDEVVRGTGAFAEIGQGRRSDADRALTEARLLDSQELAVEERVVVAAARLSGALNLDPSTRLRARGGEIPIVDLVDGSYTLAALQQIAYENRPEIAARNAGVAMMETRVKQEKTRPLLPTVAIGFSGGVFGGGSNLVMPLFGRFDGRSDFDAMAYWSAENLGVGNLALTRNRRAQRDQAWGERMRTVNRVRREVSDAYAASQAQTRNLAVARERLAAAEQGYQEDLARIRGGQGLPIELLDSLQRLVAARQAVVASAIGYDEAQFRLFVALGQPPTVALPRAQALCEPLPEAPMADSPAQ